MSLFKWHLKMLLDLDRQQRIVRCFAFNFKGEMMMEEAIDEVWQCRDGTSIMVKDMHEEHVRNALRMILRAKRKRDIEAVHGAGSFMEDEPSGGPVHIPE